MYIGERKLKKYDVILFDLDGTVTDSGGAIMNGAKIALARFGISIPQEDLRKFVGPPIWESFQMFGGLTFDESMQAIKYFREFYDTEGILQDELYDGMKQLLCDLKSAGKIVMLATSKPHVYATAILERHGVLQYFDYVWGAEFDGSRTEKVELITDALSCVPDVDKSKIVMVGDRKYDIIGAGLMGIDSIGVLHGYGNRAEFEEHNATIIAENILHLREILL